MLKTIGKHFRQIQLEIPAIQSSWFIYKQRQITKMNVRNKTKLDWYSKRKGRPQITKQLFRNIEN